MQVGGSISQGDMAYDVDMAMPLLQEAPRRKLKRFTTKAQRIIEEVADNADAPVKWPTEIKRALEELTYKQRQFVVLMAGGLPQIQAYKRAYEVDLNRHDYAIAVDANSTISKPNVAAAYHLLCEWTDRKWLLDGKEAVEECLVHLYEEAETASKASERIAATVAIMKYHGAFVSRSEVRHIHTLDADSTKGIVTELAALLSTPEPKTPLKLAQASVESITFSDPDSAEP